MSPDALALVRFGLRAPDDPRIIDTIKVIDRTLRADLPQGPLWYRYTDDGYGEHPDGSPFDGMHHALRDEDDHDGDDGDDSGQPR